MRIEDLPKEIVDGMMKKINEHPAYIGLVKKKAMYLKNGNYVLAMQTAQAMERVKQECFANYIKYYEGEVKNMRELTESMTEEDRDTMSALGNSIVMLADCLETICMETNQLLKKYHPTFHVEMFDTLQALANEASAHVRLLDGYENHTYYDNLYGDTADSLCKMILNKGRSFINKLKAYEERTNKKTRKDAKVA
jgi:hypothetical protein